MEIEYSSGPGRRTPKSKNGCLTCRHRKKKCDETRPVCRDCARFNKECIWVDYSKMSVDEITELKRRVQAQESDKKLRKRKITLKGRKSSPPTTNTHQFAPVTFATPYIDPGSPSFAQPVKPLLDSLNPSNQNPTHDAEVGNTYIADSLPTEVTQKQYGLASPGDQYQLERFSPLLSPQNQILGGTMVEPAEEMNGTPAALFQFLKEVNSFDWGTGGYIESDSVEPEDHAEPGALDRISSTFSIQSFMEQVSSLKSGSPAFSDMASSFNAAFTSGPQPSLSFLHDIDSGGLYLYTYYVEVLSKKVSIAPHSQHESNAYQRVFLPLAQKDPGVLYGILAWAGFHLGGKWMAEGSKYAEMASKCLQQGVDFENNARITVDRKTIIFKLAAALILCGAEICRGDVKFWSVYLNWCWKVLRDNGGILGFNNNKEEHWLISNFAYHDLLASSTSERGSYFPIETYNEIFIDSEGVSRGNLNPLLGVSKFLFKLIGDINKVAYEIRQCATLKKNHGDLFAGLWSSEEADSESDLDTMPHSMPISVLRAIAKKAQELESVIDNAKPESEDLVNLSVSELELQLTAFEAFQLSCKLYLRQSVLKLNPSAIECQVLVSDLVKCIDVLIESPMQATLVFPVFIAGLFTVTEAGRERMRKRFDKFMSIYGSWSLVRVKSLLETIWLQNPKGDQVVDWNKMLKDLGWVINFA